MRKVVLSMMVSADGMFEGPDHDISWHIVDDEMNQFAIELMNRVDTMLFGRLTYQLFESYWPVAAKDPTTSEDDLVIANWIERTPKIVFSTTLEKVDWNNTSLRKDNIAKEILQLKQLPGKDMIIYGSGSIVGQLTNLSLIDEYLLFMVPVILGVGTPLFKNIDEKHHLKLIDTKTFKSGVVVLRYLHA